MRDESKAGKAEDQHGPSAGLRYCRDVERHIVKVAERWIVVGDEAECVGSGGQDIKGVRLVVVRVVGLRVDGIAVPGDGQTVRLGVGLLKQEGEVIPLTRDGAGDGLGKYVLIEVEAGNLCCKLATMDRERGCRADRERIGFMFQNPPGEVAGFETAVRDQIGLGRDWRKCGKDRQSGKQDGRFNFHLNPPRCLL